MVGSPRPDLPTNLRSLKRATWFLNKALLLRRSAALFSSFPALSSTLVPSGTSLSDNTLKGTGRVLLHRQWEGRIVQTKFGLLVRTSSPGYSAKTSEKVRSPLNVLPTWPFCCEVGVSLGEEAITDAVCGEDRRMDSVYSVDQLPNLAPVNCRHRASSVAIDVTCWGPWWCWAAGLRCTGSACGDPILQTAVRSSREAKSSEVYDRLLVIFNPASLLACLELAHVKKGRQSSIIGGCRSGFGVSAQIGSWPSNLQIATEEHASLFFGRRLRNPRLFAPSYWLRVLAIAEYIASTCSSTCVVTDVINRVTDLYAYISLFIALSPEIL